MSKRRKTTVRQKIYYVLLVCVLGLGAFYAAGALFSKKVIIETSQPEEDFVVLCDWYSGLLSLHGGDWLAKRKVFVADSHKEIDCGWYFYGDFSVKIMHPLYMTMSGCATLKSCNTPYSHYEGNKIFIKPISIDQHLNDLKDKYQGTELWQEVRGFTAASFDEYYFRYYKQVKKPDIEHFKNAYSDCLIKYWQQVKAIDNLQKIQFTPEKAVETYWMMMK